MALALSHDHDHDHQPNFPIAASWLARNIRGPTSCFQICYNMLNKWHRTYTLHSFVVIQCHGKQAPNLQPFPKQRTPTQQASHNTLKGIRLELVLFMCYFQYQLVRNLAAQNGNWWQTICLPECILKTRAGLL
jgi:hypothetical protein